MAAGLYSASQIAAAATRFTAQCGAAPNSQWLAQFWAGNNSTNATITRQRISLQRSTGGVTPTNATENKWNSRSPAPAGNIVTAWGTAPTLSGSALIFMGFGLRQGYCSLQNWTPPRPNVVPQLINAEQADVRSVDTGGNVAATVALIDGEPLFLERPRRRPRRSSWTTCTVATASGVAGTMPNSNRSINVRTGQLAPVQSRRAPNWGLYYGTASGPLLLATAGTLASVGVLANQPRKVAAGALTSAGALARQPRKALAGALTGVGAFLRQARKGMAGTLTSAGALSSTRVLLKALAGALSSAGVLTNRPSKAIVGTLTSAGALVKQPRKILAGTVTSSGAFAATRVFVKALAGTLTSAGGLARRTGKALAGTLSSAGTLSRQPGRAFTGTLSSNGALAATRMLVKVLTGALMSTGSLTRRTGKVLVGALAPAGAVVKQARKVLAGTLSSAGSLLSSIFVNLMPWARHTYRTSADAPASIPAQGRAFSVAPDAAASIPASGRSFAVAADAASEQL